MIMGILDKIFGKKQKEEAIQIKTPKGDLRLYTKDFLEKDQDARIEEFWVDAIDISEDGYWILVGRRHGVFQLYDWSGRLHRLPSRPPAQVITEALFKGSYLALLTPPYLVVYLLEDKRNPQTWKSFRTTQEGVRASSGLDISGNLLAYGVVGERIYVIDISGGFGTEGLEFKKVFSYSDANIGELKLLRFVNLNRLLLSGTKGVALYDLGGSLIKRLNHPSGKGALATKDGIILSEGREIFFYDFQLESPLKSLTTALNISHMDISPDGDFLFLAGAEENQLGLVYLPEFEYIHTFEGFGYSVVRVSPDGTIYTCTRTHKDDKDFYSLRSITTNLTEFLFDADRQSQMVKRAEEEVKRLKGRLKKISPDTDPFELEEYKRLMAMDVPIRSVREVILQASRMVEEAKFEAFLEGLRLKISQNGITAEDLKEVENRIRLEGEERVGKLKDIKEEIEKHLRQRLQEHLQKVKEAIATLSSEDPRDFESLEEIKEAREFFNRLPKDLREEGQRELFRIVQEKLLDNKLKRYRIRVEDGRVYFGSEEFPRFSGERKRLKWRLKVEDRAFVKDEVYVKIAFEREDGVLLEPKRYSNLLSQKDLRSLPQWVKRYLRHLNGLFAYDPPRTPLFVAYEETPWFVKNLERFTAIVKEQMLYSEGILILEGDAGVGKNFLVEVFSALTNRPLYIVPCNSKMEREDITFVYEFDPKRGTKRVYSDLVKALQTPGAVIYFDEINTLPPGMVKLFNPLFDYRRYLTLPTGEVIKAHKEIILVGGMNPQNYLGVSELPQDIKSRADILFIDYPPFEEEGGFYSADEALILRSQVPELSLLSSEDFLYLWHHVVNGIKVKKMEGIERLEEHVWKLFELIKIANAIRKAYRAYQAQQSEEPVDFVFSIRDTIRCARRLNRYSDVKALVMESILPKVSSPLEREILKSIIERL